jgi:hypothetical protein
MGSIRSWEYFLPTSERLGGILSELSTISGGAEQPLSSKNIHFTKPVANLVPTGKR